MIAARELRLRLAASAARKPRRRSLAAAACTKVAGGSWEQLYTAAAVEELGVEVAHRTVPARPVGNGQRLGWARALDNERVWVIEDVRNVSGSLERLLTDRGETVARIPPLATELGGHAYSEVCIGRAPACAMNPTRSDGELHALPDASLGLSRAAPHE